MYATTTPSAHLAHCSHRSQHWGLIELACDRSDVTSIAILTNPNISTRKIQKLQKNKFLRIIVCGEGKKVDTVCTASLSARVDVRQLRAPPAHAALSQPHTAHDGQLNMTMSVPCATNANVDIQGGAPGTPFSDCDFTLIIGLDVSGEPTFAVIGNYRLGSLSKSAASITREDPLDRSTYVAIPEVAKTMYTLFCGFWAQATVCRAAQEAFPLLRQVGQETKPVRAKPKSNNDHLVHVAQGLHTNVAIGLSIGNARVHAALMSAALRDPQIQAVDILFGADVDTKDLFSYVSAKPRVRVVRVGTARGGDDLVLPATWSSKYIAPNVRDGGGRASCNVKEKKKRTGTLTSQTKSTNSSGMFILIGRTSDGRAAFSLEGSIYSRTQTPPAACPVSGTHLGQSALSYCMYLKSSDATGIVEAYARDFDDIFALS
jgi:hypothetical protein